LDFDTTEGGAPPPDPKPSRTGRLVAAAGITAALVTGGYALANAASAQTSPSTTTPPADAPAYGQVPGYGQVPDNDGPRGDFRGDRHHGDGDCPNMGGDSGGGADPGTSTTPSTSSGGGEV
jgi:hypothetical protein